MRLMWPAQSRIRVAAGGWQAAGALPSPGQLPQRPAAQITEAATEKVKRQKGCEDARMRGCVW